MTNQIEETLLKEDGNTLKFTGEISSLPICKGCSTGLGEHTLLTQEHPYKLVEVEEKPKQEEGENK